QQPPQKEELDKVKLSLDQQQQHVLELQANLKTLTGQLQSYAEEITDSEIANKLTIFNGHDHALDASLSELQLKLRAMWKEQQASFEQLEKSSQVYEQVKKQFEELELKIETLEREANVSSKSLEKINLDHTTRQ